jgi:hypothetical protein
MRREQGLEEPEPGGTHELSAEEVDVAKPETERVNPGSLDGFDNRLEAILRIQGYAAVGACGAEVRTTSAHVSDQCVLEIEAEHENPCVECLVMEYFRSFEYIRIERRCWDDVRLDLNVVWAPDCN